MSLPENHIFTYFDLAQVKDILKIRQDDDHDNILLRNTFGPQAERWIINQMTPFTDALPLEGDDLETAMGAANKYAVAHYKTHKNQLDASKEWMKMAKEDMVSLMIALKARHTGRTRISISSRDYDTETDLLSSQRLFR